MSKHENELSMEEMELVQGGREPGRKLAGVKYVGFGGGVAIGSPGLFTESDVKCLEGHGCAGGGGGGS